MNIDLNNNQNLVNFFNELFQNEELTNIAPDIIKFFIITRNYGLINFQENLDKLKNKTNFNELAINVIKKGFQKDNIPFDNTNLVTFLITNYHDNGFYFHAFPGIYQDSIRKNGIMANSRNEDDEKYFAIATKYHFGEYFVKANNRICVSEKIGNPYTPEYAIFTPEWLDMFLKQGNYDTHDTFRNGDIKELQTIAQNALNYFHEGMKRNPLYDEKDYLFLSNYIKEVINRRFINGNKEVGIALIEKGKSDIYFKKHIQKEDIVTFNKYIKSQKMNDNDIIDFIINVLSNGEKISNKTIPSNLINIISYQINTNYLSHNKTI